MWHYQGFPNQQQSICQTNSNTVVIRLRILHWGLQQQHIITSMENSIIMKQETHTEPIRFPRIININLHDHPITGKRFTHIVIHK